MIKAIIIDDEPLACLLLRDMLKQHDDIQIVDECNDGFAGLKSIQDHNPDLIFLDIQMPKITGLEMLELLDQPPKVIFTTAYDEYAIKAFELNAIDYLLKPYSQERLDQSLQRIKSQKQSNATVPQSIPSIATAESANRIVVKDGNTIKIIPLNEVIYLEAAADYVKVTTKDRYYLKHGTMQHFEDTLPSDLFLRCHRSYLVNIHFIGKVELMEKGSHAIVLTNNQLIPVSKSGYAKLKAFLG